MSKEKQIEEMAKVIKSSLDDLGSGNFHFTGDEISTMFAKFLYNAGYRKQGENVIELPCKVGDTIFVIRNDIIEQETVRGIKIGNCGLYLQVSRGFDDFEYHYDIEIGNKLFFEKEEAEAKMKGV